MKQELMAEVMQQMLPYLDNAQLKQLRQVINAKKARSYAVSEALMPPEDYLEILRFRHYTRFWNFESKGKNSRRKSIINSIEVSVILHLVTVDSF